MLLPGLEAVVGLAGGVDQRLACPGGAADGQLLQGAAVAAHGVTFEVGEDEHGVVVRDVVGDVVFLEHLAVRYGPDVVFALRLPCSPVCTFTATLPGSSTPRALYIFTTASGVSSQVK